MFAPTPSDAGIFRRASSIPTAHGAAGGALSTGIRTPWVRDLAWLLGSPPLLSREVFTDRLADPVDEAIFGAGAQARLIDLLHELDASAAPVLEGQQERRLGRYAERLLAFWLHRDPGVNVHSMGLPVREAGRTLGECDALFSTSSSREHWELAVKFYLCLDGAGDSPSAPAAPAALPSALEALRGCDAYVGAGLADRFDWKLKRLIEHQLPLSRHPELLALAPGPWAARMFVKGRLFYPLERWHDANAADATDVAAAAARGGTSPSALASDHLRGWWATMDTWQAWARTSTCRWTALARLDWLAPLEVDASRAMGADAFADTLVSPPRDTAGTHGDSKGMKDGKEDGAIDDEEARCARGLLHPVQVAALTPAIPGAEALPGQMANEVSRGFIVPNDWPARAERFRRNGAK